MGSQQFVKDHAPPSSYLMACQHYLETNCITFQEYCAVRIIPMSQVINAAEIDPVSRSKNFCLQIIAEERSYGFCAPDEEALAKWLGALKSIIVVRKKAID